MNDAGEGAVGPGDNDAAEALLALDGQRLIHGRVLADERQPRTRMHHLPGGLEHGAELAAGVEAAEIMGGEAALFEQRDGKRIAERQLHGGRCGGREPVGAGFWCARQHECDIGCAAQGRIPVGGKGDQRDAMALGIGDQVRQLAGLA